MTEASAEHARKIAKDNSPPARRSVFINCPFDPAYSPLFRAMCFAVLACGQLDSSSGLPRFNMPLELGADRALRLRGPARHRRRRVLVLDAACHRYDQTLSDISGMDIEAHGNDPAQM